jgi:hypothetical protein
MSTPMSGNILGVSAPMFSSVATGAVLLLLALTLFWLMLVHRGSRRMSTHKALTWTLLGAAALHGIWGIVAVFVLKS